MSSARPRSTASSDRLATRDRTDSRRHRDRQGDQGRADRTRGQAARAGGRARAGHGPGRRRPGLDLVRQRQAQGLRRGRHRVDPRGPAGDRDAGGDPGRRTPPQRRTRPAPATSCSCRCRRASTRTPSSARSTRPRTPTACTRPTSAGWCSARPRRCRARRSASSSCCAATSVEINGADVVVVGRGVTVGRPLGLLLTRRSENATVTLCHTGTRDLAAHVRQADIVVAAAGVPGIITGDMVKPGAAVLDVGVSRVDGKLAGDVDPVGVRRRRRGSRPNPGGVGPMTRAMLLSNVVATAEAAARSTLGVERRRVTMRDEPRRIPSTLGGLVYLIVVAASAVGLLIVAFGPWRRGVALIGLGLLFGALARIVLSRPQRRHAPRAPQPLGRRAHARWRRHRPARAGQRDPQPAGLERQSSRPAARRGGARRRRRRCQGAAAGPTRRSSPRGQGRGEGAAEGVAGAGGVEDLVGRHRDGRQAQPVPVRAVGAEGDQQRARAGQPDAREQLAPRARWRRPGRPGRARRRAGRRTARR